MHHRSSSILKQTNKQDENKVTIPSLQPKQLNKKLRVLTWQGGWDRHSYFRILLYRWFPSTKMRITALKIPITLFIYSPVLSLIYSVFSLDELYALSLHHPFHLYTRFISSHLLMSTSRSSHLPSFLSKYVTASPLWKNNKWITKPLLVSSSKLSSDFCSLR